jgi:hypothetical protein
MIILTVKEAIEKVKKGGSLSGIVLDKNSIEQVNVQDAMLLSEGGIVIPEENIYYDDSEIEFDEEIDNLVIKEEIVKLSWEEKAKRAEEFKNGLKILLNLTTQKPEIDDWMAKNKNKLESLLKPIIISLFNAEKLIKD